MTEEEWLTCTDPQLMLAFLRGKASDRKLRLFAVAWGYDVRPQMLDRCSREADATAERYADGLAGYEYLLAAFRRAQEAWNAIEVIRGGRHGKGIRAGKQYLASKQAAEVARNAADPGWSRRIAPRLSWRLNAATRYALSGYLRDIIGSPFRPVTIDPNWVTSTVVGLASAIYDDRAFDRLPILADALEEAGCDSPDVLTHLRGDGPHVRGCWAVDLVLGKE